MKFIRVILLALTVVFLTASSAFAEKEYLNTPRNIRIGLSLLGHPSTVEISSSNGFLEITEIKKKKVLFSGKTTNATIKAKKNGTILFSVNKKELVASSPVIIASTFPPRAESSAISFKVAGKKLKTYRGSFEIKSLYSSLYIVNIIDIEDYLKSVVPSEISTRAPNAAQEAQAIAARTYAIRNINRHSKKDNCNLCDKIHCQAYFGVIKESAPSNKAIKSTLGKILTYGAYPANTVYHSNCGGYIISSQTAWGGNPVPYLVGHFDGVKGHKAFCEYGKLYLNKKSKIELPTKSKKLVVGITGANHKKKTHSNFGHRVGMCQDGAIGMAAIGYSCNNILGFYYPKTKIETLRYAVNKNKDKCAPTKIMILTSKGTKPEGKKPAKTTKQQTSPTANEEVSKVPVASGSANLTGEVPKIAVASSSANLTEKAGDFPIASATSSLVDEDLAYRVSTQIEVMKERLSSIKYVLREVGTTKPNSTSKAIKKLYWSPTAPSISKKEEKKAKSRRKRRKRR